MTTTKKPMDTRRSRSGAKGKYVSLEKATRTIFGTGLRSKKLPFGRSPKTGKFYFTIDEGAQRKKTAKKKSSAPRKLKVGDVVVVRVALPRVTRMRTALPTVDDIRLRVLGSASSLKPPPATLAYAPGLEALVAENASLSSKASELAEEVTFTVATKTVSGKPIRDARGMITRDNYKEFRPDEPVRDKAFDELTRHGFTIIRRGRFSTTVRGPAKLLNELLEEPLMLMRQAAPSLVRAMHSFGAADLLPRADELFVAPSTSLSVQPKKLSSVFDHFVFAPPPLLFEPPEIAAAPPAAGYHHVSPAAIRRLLNVPTAGAFSNLTGSGVKVGIIDTGFEISHPFYANGGVSITAHATPGGSPGTQDEEGHGTAMASNIFTIAPQAEVHGVRKETSPHADSVEVAVDELGVDIVTCSWGWPNEQVFSDLELSLNSIIDDGKLVLFAAGNGQYAWPGSMPAVISVGGVFADAAGQLEASNYASGFMSSMYPQRLIPDFCGLCGQLPKAIYIPMPVPSGCRMDKKYAGTPFPDFDTTMASDGWVYASGTSAATPQIAGVLALLLQATRAKGTTLTNAIAKDLLQQSAQHVGQGRNAMGFPATPSQPNGAVGWGLVNVDALFTLAQGKGLI